MFHTTQYHQLDAIKQPNNLHTTRKYKHETTTSRLQITFNCTHIQHYPHSLAYKQCTHNTTQDTLLTYSTKYTVWIRLAYTRILTVILQRLHTPYIGMTIRRWNKYTWDWNQHVPTTQEFTHPTDTIDELVPLYWLY
jgi:hypothetical protein